MEAVIQSFIESLFPPFGDFMLNVHSNYTYRSKIQWRRTNLISGKYIHDEKRKD